MPRRIVLTIEEAAQALGIGRTLMYALVMSGEVESVQIGRSVACRSTRSTPTSLACAAVTRRAPDGEEAQEARLRVEHLTRAGAATGDCRVTVGVRDDGRPDRRHMTIMGVSHADVVQKVRKLEQERENGRTRRASRKVWTVEGWLRHWLENISGPFVKENTALGRHRAPGVPDRPHRAQRGAAANSAQLAKALRLVEEEIEPYTGGRSTGHFAGGRRVTDQCAVSGRVGTRGSGKGEALALRWADVYLDAGTLGVRRSRL